MSAELIPVVILNDTGTEGHIGCVGVMRMFRSVCEKNGMRVVKTFVRSVIESNPRAVKKRIVEVGAKLIIVNGEGTFHRSGSIWGNFMGSLPKGIPAVLVNTVWDKMFVDKTSLSRFEFITVRESLSYDALLGLKPSVSVTVVPDILFFMKAGPNGVGYGDSVMGLVANQLAARTNYFPVNRVYSPDVSAYLCWLSRLRVYVTGRFHGVVLAAIAGTPFLSFPSNSHKVEGLLKDMGCSELLLNSMEEMEGKIEAAVATKDRVKKYCEEAIKKIDDLGVRLRAVCLK